VGVTGSQQEVQIIIIIALAVVLIVVLVVFDVFTGTQISIETKRNRRNKSRALSNHLPQLC
jgi:uncharacterized membrane protein